MTDAELPRDRVNDDLPREPVLRVASATKRFGGVVAVDNVDLDVRDGEFLCLLGPSGCGKTTLLRMMAGFENLTVGRILLDGRDITSDPPHRRPLNMMFQSYALFPHLSVENNIAFGLKRDGMPATEIAKRVAEMLALVRLDGYGARKPHQLSGGQRQRVALARALAKRPRVLLLDEPMAALDRKLREETQIELKNLQADLGLTFITVTHDQTEALTMADRIAVMHAGKIAQIGAPRDIYQRPANLTVARFIGDISMFDGVARAGEATGEISFDCAAPAMTFTIVANADPDRFACRHAAVRPENIKLYPWRPSDQPNVMQGTIVQSLYRGEARLLIVDVDGVPVRVAQSNAIGADNELEIGASVWLSIPPDALILLRD